MAKRGTMRELILPLVILGGLSGGAYLLANPEARGFLNLESDRHVHRRPFDVPRLAKDGRYGRPVTFEEIENRIQDKRLTGSRGEYDLANLVALDPVRGFRVAKEVLRASGTVEGHFRAHDAWDVRVAALDDAWAKEYRGEVLKLNRSYFASTPESLAEADEQERKADFTSIPGLDGYWGNLDTAAYVYEHRHRHGSSYFPMLGLGDPPPPIAVYRNETAIRRLKTEDQFAAAMAKADREGTGEDFVRWASALYPDLPAPVQQGILALYRISPGRFRETTLGELLDWPAGVTNWDIGPDGKPKRRPLSFDPRKGSHVDGLVRYWPIIPHHRRAEIRTYALARLEKGETWPAAALIERTPDDKELRERLHKAQWERLDIYGLIKTGNAEALEFARKWVASGNPVHEWDGATLAGLPQADAITEPILRSRASIARATMLEGLARRKDPEADRRLRILANDPAPRVRYAARRMIEARESGATANRPRSTPRLEAIPGA